MTKKSAARVKRDIAAGRRRNPGNEVALSPVAPNAMKPTDNGGYKISAADRILQECAAGLGLVPQAQKQVNSCWDDLMNVYRQCAGMLFQHTMVTQVLNDKELTGFVDDLQTFNANVAQFARDLAQMNKELQDLRALHGDKTGGSEDPEVVLHSFAVYEQYKLWMTKHDGVVLPVITHILEQTNKAELLRQAAHAALQSANPAENLDAGVLDVNTITDVEVREVAEGRSLRGQTSSVYAIDEAGFMPLEATTPVQNVQTPA